MTLSQNSVGCLVANVSLGREGKTFQSEIDRLVKTNGQEWLTARMKSIMNAALHIRNGEPEQARTLYQENSISYNKTTMIPKGPLGIPVTHFLQAQRKSAIKRSLAAMRVYTQFILPEVSPKQRDKAIKAITSPSRSIIPVEGLEDEGSRFFLDCCSRRGVNPFRYSRPFGENEIHAEHLFSTSKYYSRYPLPRELRKVPYASMCNSFMTEPWIPETLDSMVPCQEMRQMIRDGWSKEHPQEFSGKITFLQEQGCKARVVYQPSAWLQMAFMPLHNRIADLADELFPKESCVKDQEYGALMMDLHLKKGGSVFCTDLSSATDRFPRAFSIGVLRACGLPQYADALEAVCGTHIKCDETESGYVQYATGQPMGLYGSFPLFHLSNLLVAEEATQSSIALGSADSFPDGTFFKVVGDDIVFSDELAAMNYRELMSDYGVDISESKSFSGRVGEFAGFVSVPTNKSTITCRPYKVPHGDNITNTLQFLDAIGSKLKGLNPYWSKMVDKYLLTLPSRSLTLEPLIPDFEKDNVRSSNRGDNSSMESLCCYIIQSSDRPYPPMETMRRVSRNPLFRERGMFDYYGYNPELLAASERDAKDRMRHVGKQLSKDPLIREIDKASRGEPVGHRIVPTPDIVKFTNNEQLRKRMEDRFNRTLENLPKVDNPEISGGLDKPSRQ